jgi:hypothetical protein
MSTMSLAEMANNPTALVDLGDRVVGKLWRGPELRESVLEIFHDGRPVEVRGDERLGTLAAAIATVIGRREATAPDAGRHNDLVLALKDAQDRLRDREEQGREIAEELAAAKARERELADHLDEIAALSRFAESNSTYLMGHLRKLFAIMLPPPELLDAEEAGAPLPVPPVFTTPKGSAPAAPNPEGVGEPVQAMSPADNPDDESMRDRIAKDPGPYGVRGIRNTWDVFLRETGGSVSAHGMMREAKEEARRRNTEALEAKRLADAGMTAADLPPEQRAPVPPPPPAGLVVDPPAVGPGHPVAAEAALQHDPSPADPTGEVTPPLEYAGRPTPESCAVTEDGRWANDLRPGEQRPRPTGTPSVVLVDARVEAPAVEDLPAYFLAHAPVPQAWAAGTRVAACFVDKATPTGLATPAGVILAVTDMNLVHVRLDSGREVVLPKHNVRSIERRPSTPEPAAAPAPEAPVDELPYYQVAPGLPKWPKSLPENFRSLPEVGGRLGEPVSIAAWDEEAGAAVTRFGCIDKSLMGDLKSGNDFWVRLDGGTATVAVPPAQLRSLARPADPTPEPAPLPPALEEHEPLTDAQRIALGTLSKELKLDLTVMKRLMADVTGLAPETVGSRDLRQRDLAEMERRMRVEAAAGF